MGVKWEYQGIQFVTLLCKHFHVLYTLGPSLQIDIQYFYGENATAQVSDLAHGFLVKLLDLVSLI